MKMTLTPKKNGNIMNGSRRKGRCLQFDRWLSLSASMILMGCSGLTYTYAVYSEHIKIKFHYTQEQIDNIGAAKDFGAFVALVSGFFYNFYAPWVTVYIGALLRVFGYGLMWLTIADDTPRSIWMLCLYVALGTGGDGWIDTACMMTSVENFEDHRGTAMGILKSQLGLSGAMFVTIYQAFLKPDVNKFILLIAVVPTVLYLLLGFLISPSTQIEKYRDIRGTMLRFKVIYAKFHAGNGTSDFFAILMLIIIAVMYAVPVVQKPLSSGRYLSSPKNSLVKEIDLIPNPVRSLNHTKSLDVKSESHAADCETEIFPLKVVPGFIEEELVESSELGNVKERFEAPNIVETEIFGDCETEIFHLKVVPGFIEEELVESSEPGNVKEHIEAQNIVDLTVWECLVAVDFWLVNFVVVSGGGSGVAIINNFAQIGSAARSEEVGLYVGIISVGSCFGRITSGYASDFLVRSGYPRPLCLLITQVIMTLSCILLATGDVFFLYIGSALIGMAYGAYWTLSPAVLSEIFGMKSFAILYKIIGICPTIGSYVLSAKILGVLYDKQAALYHHNTTEETMQGEVNACYGQQCFGSALLYLSVICFIGGLACLWLIKRTNRLYSRRYQLLQQTESS